MDKKGSVNIILIIVIAILSLSLAILAGVIFFASRPEDKSVDAVVKPTVLKPGDANLGILELFPNEDKIFNLKYEDGKKAAYIKINGEIWYNKGIKNADKVINAYYSSIVEAVSTYFQNMTLEEARQPEKKQIAKKELKDILNKMINESEKYEYNYIYDIIFDEWFYQ